MNESLIKAAEYIDEHGWTQGAHQDEDGKVCLLGSLEAVGVCVGGYENFKTLQHLQKFVQVKHYARSIPVFNDYVLTSAEEASKALREAAEWEG